MTEKLKANASLKVHGPCVDLEDLGPTFKVRQPKLNLPVQLSWLKKRWV
jgi:hypothetical protein